MFTRRSFVQTLAVGTLGAMCPPAFSTARKQAPLFPNPLKPGATLGLIAPATAIDNPERIEKTKQALSEMGYRLVETASVRPPYGYLAGTDAARAQELQDMFANPEVEAILVLQGGWGCARILPLLNYDLIRQHPKILCGFSDVTALLNGIHAQTGLVTFHGPNGFSDWNAFNRQSWEATLRGDSPLSLPPAPENPDDVETGRFTITPGKAAGALVGGNLTVLSNMVGSRYLPDFEGKILLLEDIDEAVYRIDRMLTHLALAKILGKVAGIVFASCRICKAREASYDFSLKKLLIDKLQPLGVPAFFGTYSGHIAQQYTLPIGGHIEMDADTGMLVLV